MVWRRRVSHAQPEQDLPGAMGARTFAYGPRGNWCRRYVRGGAASNRTVWARFGRDLLSLSAEARPTTGAAFKRRRRSGPDGDRVHAGWTRAVRGALDAAPERFFTLVAVSALSVT